MSLVREIPGRCALELEHLLLDVNGTVTDRGTPIQGVEERLDSVGVVLEVHLLSADTFGTLGAVASLLRARAVTVVTGDDKLAYLGRLGAERCIAVGNGANDVPMLQAAALGIAVVGPEGAAGAAVRAADVVCRSILEALDLLLDETALRATLRA